MMNIIVYMLGLLSVWGTHLTSGPTFYVFIAFYLVHFAAYPAKKAFSPLSIFYAYYGLWYILAPLFADRYQNKLFLPEYSLAVAMAYTVFGLGILAICIGIKYGRQQKKEIYVKGLGNGRFLLDPTSLRNLILILYITSSVLVLMIVQSSGGVARWLANPGDAFLNRSGSGVFVVLSHFSSIILALLSGYYAYTYKKLLYLCAFIFWVLLTSPVHGSKMQISLLIVLGCLPWLRYLRIVSFKSFLLYGVFVFVFTLGLYSRGYIKEFNSSALIMLNYFSTLENLAVSVRDFKPDVMKTFFLPFRKFQTPIGLVKPDFYFDMNHYLTDKYYPEHWKLRATEQWPVETDLYLNFKFFWGLPLVFLYLSFVGYLYGQAMAFQNLGIWGSSFLMTILMISHLRGSLINHTDFYMYPFIILMYFILNKLHFFSKDNKVIKKADCE